MNTLLLFCANIPFLFFLLASLLVWFQSIGNGYLYSFSWYIYIKIVFIFLLSIVFNYSLWVCYKLGGTVGLYPYYLYYISPVVFFVSAYLCICVWKQWYGDFDIRENPSICWDRMPDFPKITTKLLEQGCIYALRETPRRWDKFVRDKSQKDLSEFLYDLKDVFEPASKVLSVLHHLHSVNDSPEIRRIHSAYVHKFDPLFRRIEHFPEVESFYQNRKNFSPVFAKVIEDIYNGLVDIGANLSFADRKRYLALSEKVQKLGTTFGQNLLDETQSYELWLKDSDLDGLSKDFVSLLCQSNVSKEFEKEGKFWKVTLSPPVVTEFLTYSKRADLREKVYKSYASRATSGEKDNTPIIREILDARSEVAEIMGYEDYGSYGLRTEMAENPQKVFDFLQGIQDKSFFKAKSEYEELQNLKREIEGEEELHPWDIAYFSEILKKRKFDISDELTRPYFPKDRALDGLFSILGELFGFLATREVGKNGWHQDVIQYSLDSRVSGTSEHIGIILFDLYAREGKRSGGWMSHFSSRYKDRDGKIHKPVAYIVCNFRPPLEGEDAYLTLNELETLFHEVGHVLHHILTLQDQFEISGMGGVPHDAVEFPSQFMENWLWQEKTLHQISSHKKTGETIPSKMVTRLKESKTFQSGLFLVRQIYFGMIDMIYHTKFCSLRKERGSSDGIDIRKMSQELAAKLLPYKTPEYSHFENTFSHIFDGGYDAGYYGYLWAEVLAADAFDFFEENGVFNRELGKKFREIILGGGGSKPFMELYRDFRGKDPSQSALLKQMGIR